jgi:hypothetical protein
MRIAQEEAMRLDNESSPRSARRRTARALRAGLLAALAAAAGAVAQEPGVVAEPGAAAAVETVAQTEELRTRFTVEVSLRATRAEAERIAAGVRRRLGPTPPVRVESRASSFVVRVGHFARFEEAAALRTRLREAGYGAAFVAAVGVPVAQPVYDLPGTRTDRGTPAEPVPEAIEVPAPIDVTPGPIPEPVPLPEVTPEGLPETAPPTAPAPIPEPGPVPAIEPVPEAPPPAVPPLPAGDGKRLRAMRVDQAPTLDGRLDEPAWSVAHYASGFEQKGESRGYPVAERAEVAFLFDDDALYVGARIQSRPGAAPHAARSRRDDAADADRLIVSLDTYRNRQTAYSFGVTAGGTRIDYYQPVDVYEVRDFSFDPVWDARTEVNGTEWTAEMRIPFSSLQFHRGEEQVWGVNLQRISPQDRLYTFWVVVPAAETGWSSRFGDLVGLEGVRPHRRFAVVPYAAGQRISSDFAPADAEEETDWRFGGDVVFDLTPSLALEATINPDFGQIEADPAVVNLTAYEIFFPEKRPFFVEGSQLLQGGGPRYFYSRRIGAPPRGDDGDLFEDPGTTILGAAKLIGRLANGLSVGTLLAATEDEAVPFTDPETGEFFRIAVEPATYYGVTRLQKDVGAGSTFGFVATGVQRDIADGDPLARQLATGAASGGIDWNLRFARQRLEFGGFLGGSYVEGDSAAILRLQGSSARYYNRPDADYVEVDPTRTRLTGYTGGLRLADIHGKWRWFLSGEARSPGFEINDLGAMATADDLVGFGQVSWGSPMTGSFQRIDVAASVASGWNFGNVRQFTIPSLRVDLVWKNFWKTYARVSYDTPSLSDSLTRSGPLMETAEGWRSQFGLYTNDAKRTVWSVDGTTSSDELGGWAWSAGTQLRVRLADHLSFAVGPGYERAKDSRQFYDRVTGGRPETFGDRYVFAVLDRSTVYVRLRAGIAFTPDLGFDLYVEPFVASGRYQDLGELALPRDSAVRLYGTDGTTITRLEDGTYEVVDGESLFTLPDLDFDVTSFRGNAVLHWDYAQGSTLYLVWQQNRAGDQLPGVRAEPGDLADVFDSPAENVFSVKASFRLDFD